MIENYNPYYKNRQQEIEASPSEDIFRPDEDAVRIQELIERAEAQAISAVCEKCKIDKEFYSERLKMGRAVEQAVNKEFSVIDYIRSAGNNIITMRNVESDEAEAA